jgi:hypothetical protein
MELTMNVNCNVFLPSQGVETGIREELAEMIRTEFPTQPNNYTVQKDENITDQSIFNEMRKGETPVSFLFKEIMRKRKNEDSGYSQVQDSKQY